MIFMTTNLFYSQNYKCPIRNGEIFIKSELAMDEKEPYLTTINSATDSIVKSVTCAKVVNVRTWDNNKHVNIIVKSEQDKVVIGYFDLKSTKLKIGDEILIDDEIGIAEKYKLDKIYVFKDIEDYWVGKYTFGIKLYSYKNLISEDITKDGFNCEKQIIDISEFSKFSPWVK